MPNPILQPRFLHASSFASVMIQVSEHLFPDAKFFALSQDQRRIVTNETQNLLLQARWVVESKAFAQLFATPQVGVDMVTADTVLGDPMPASPGGHFV